MRDYDEWVDKWRDIIGPIFRETEGFSEEDWKEWIKNNYEGASDLIMSFLDLINPQDHRSEHRKDDKNGSRARAGRGGA